MFYKYRLEILFCLLLACLVSWEYRDTFQNPSLVGDDYMNTVRSLDRSFYVHIKAFLAPNNSYDNRPLGNLLYRGLYGWFGISPLPYIAVLFVLHLANSLLGFFLASILLKNRFLAFLCASAWAINFNVAGSVYSFNSVYDQLTFFFWTACLLLYLINRARPRLLWYGGSLLCFLLCTRCKEEGLALVLALMAYEIFFLDGSVWKSRQTIRTAMAEILRRQWPFCLFALLYVIFYIKGAEWGPNSMPADPYYMKIDYQTFLDGLKNYLSLVAFNSGAFQTSVAVYLGFGAALMAVAFLRQKFLGWSLLTFVFALLPVIFFPNARRQIYLYIPLFYFAMTMTGIIGFAVNKAREHQRYLGTALACIVLVFLSYQYYKTNSSFQGNIREAIRRERAVTNAIVEYLHERYPEIPTDARFYFIGLPKHISNPDLLLTYMPRLLYRNINLNILVVSNGGKIPFCEIGRADDNFLCFDLTAADPGDIDTYEAAPIVDCTPRMKRNRTVADGGGWSPEEIEKALPEVPGVRFVIHPEDVRAGEESLEFRLIGMEADTLDVLYTINGRLMPVFLGWHLEEGNHTVQPVGAKSEKGLYHIIGIRTSDIGDACGWIKVDASARIR